jgi:hypothetical protein
MFDITKVDPVGDIGDQLRGKSVESICKASLNFGRVEMVHIQRFIRV